MSAFTKSQLAQIDRALKGFRSEVRLGGVWAILNNQYGIGRREADILHLTANDRRHIQILILQVTGLDLTEANLDGSRTDLAKQGAFNEKLGTMRPLAKRVVCTALLADVLYGNDVIKVIKDVEYRLDYRKIDLSKYKSILVVENYETFLQIHDINWMPHGPTLVLYRGHDKSASAVNGLLASFPCGQIEVIFFTDPDPAGVNLIHEAPAATHALIPDLSFVSNKTPPGRVDRLTAQQLHRPRLLEVLKEKALISPEFILYAQQICSGLALSQEDLVAKQVPLRVVKILQDARPHIDLETD